MNHEIAVTVEAEREARSVAQEPAARASRLRYELGLVGALWRRDMLRLRKEPSRWFGVVLQPLLFWAIIGSGMGESFQLPGAEGVSYLTYFYPGILMMIVLFTTIFGTISVIEDRQSGFLQAVVVTPASRLSLVVGKVLGVTTLAMIQAAIFLVLAPLAGYPLGSVAWPAVVVVLLLTSMGLTALSLAGAWVMRTTQAYHAVMSIVLLPLWIVSGAMFPPHGAVLGAVMAANPMRYAVDGLRESLGSSAVVSASSSSVGLSVSLMVLSGFAALSLGLATWVCGRRRR